MSNQPTDETEFVAKVVEVDEGDDTVIPETNSEQDDRSDIRLEEAIADSDARSDARAAAIAPVVEAHVSGELTIFAAHVDASLEEQAREYQRLLTASFGMDNPVVKSAANERARFRMNIKSLEKELTRKKWRDLVLIGLAGLLVVLGALQVLGIRFFT